MDELFSIIDSHIHLFPQSEIETLAWHSPGHPLDSQHSVEQYRAAIASQLSRVRGFVFVETDRISSAHESSGWKHALEEVAWLGRIASGKPRPGEGHTPEDKDLCLAIVPWAPVPAGREQVRKYIYEMETSAQTTAIAGQKITGFRYLVQDKPRGTMLTDDFVEGLMVLADLGYSFDLGVDFRSGGSWQLDEAIEMIRRVSEELKGKAQLKIVINHMCKPDMLSTPFAPAQTASSLPSFVEWRERMVKLAAFPNTYMKLSGGFSEIAPLPSHADQMALNFWDRHELLDRTTAHIGSWASEVLRLWGSSRCMFASDWPVSNIGGGGNHVAWSNWKSVVSAVISHLTPEEKRMVWSGTAEMVYKIPRKSQ